MKDTLFQGPNLGSLFEIVLERSFEAILITDAEPENHKILYANDKFCQMTGYTREELYGKNPRILQGKRTSRRVIERLKAALASASPFIGATFNYNKLGEVYPVQWNVYPVLDEHQQPQYFVSIQQDLSELRNSLARLKSSSASFRHFLSELKSQGQSDSEQYRVAHQGLVENSKVLSRYVNRTVTEKKETEEFFDFDSNIQKASEHKPAKRAISAEHYIASIGEDNPSINELVGLAHSLASVIELESLTDISMSRRKELISDIQEIANALFFLEEFMDVSVALSELAVAMYHNVEKEYDIIISEAIKGLVIDLDTWISEVFVARSADNVHMLDDSIVGSCGQILVFCRIDDNEEEDDDELW
ncbi:PAS domain-containing protein [Alteromonas sediminis]|nr:PAS domain S-box protein [Alteromonas sediminis]